MPRDRENKYPVRQNTPADRAASYNDRMTGLGDPPKERRRRQSSDRATRVINQTPDVATAVGTHDHSGVYSPVGHTHTSGSITDFTEAAQDAVLGVVGDSATIDATYNDAGNTLSLSVIADTTVQKVDVRKNSAGTVFSRRRINLIEGANVTLTVADDAGGNEVDITIAAALAAGSSGIDLIYAGSFSGVTSHSLPANTFSGTYENYWIVISDLSNASAAQSVSIRLRAAGVDSAAATYYYGSNAVFHSGAQTYTQGAGITLWALNTAIAGGTNIDFGGHMLLMRPNLADPTNATWQWYGHRQGVDVLTYQGGGQFIATTVFDSLSLVSSSGNMSGTIRVYGLRNTP